MAWQQTVQAAIRTLRKEEQRLEKQLEALSTRIADVESLGARAGRKGATRKAGKKRAARLSPKGREAISRAARRRWAAYRAQKKKASS